MVRPNPEKIDPREKITWESAPILNASEHPRATLFRMWAGEMDPTVVYVWATSFDSAFEELVEWLDENAPGRLTKLDEGDLKSAAKDEGIAWKAGWPDWDDPEFQKVQERAEADLTVIGHTSLKHGTHIASWEWGGDEIHPGGKQYAVVLGRSRLENCARCQTALGDDPVAWPLCEECRLTVADTLADKLEDLSGGLTDDARKEGSDIRLQVLDWDDDYVLHTGDASYDTDHHGDWGASTLDADMTRQQCDLLALELLDEAADGASEKLSEEMSLT